MNQRVIISISDGVADVRLNRPDKMNALDPEMFAALVAAGERLIGEAGLRAVVLSGEGRAFCAGLDMKSFERMGSGAAAASAQDPLAGRLTARTHGISNSAQRVATVWRDVPVPVIAAVHGVAFGGGLQVALGADIRLIAPDARMSVMEIKWGLVPDMGGILLMRQLARDDVVRQLAFSGRQFAGAEAVALGFATRVESDPRAAALAFAREIAQKSPDAVRGAKRLLNLPNHDAAAVLMAESVEQEKVMGSPNQVEAVLANMENRVPRFRD